VVPVTIFLTHLFMSTPGELQKQLRLRLRISHQKHCSVGRLDKLMLQLLLESVALDLTSGEKDSGWCDLKGICLDQSP